MIPQISRSWRENGSALEAVRRSRRRRSFLSGAAHPLPGGPMQVQKRAVILLIVCLAFLASGARAQEEQEPGKDHPSIPRFPGMTLADARETDFNFYDFRLSAREEHVKRVEGRSWELTYVLKEGARQPSSLEIIRNYTNQFKARGGRVIHEEITREDSWATMMTPLGAGERWLHVETVNRASIYYMTIIETAAMQQKLEFSADEMAEQLKSAGKVTLRGILFDTGKSEIKPESNALLDEVAAMLKANADWKLHIEGHTDNVGAKAANLQLSKGRAAAVKAALVARGVSAQQITTEGYGDTKAVADNSTEEGRAQNRRVELVKK
jgi:outer membrane protein OmpA-like peptidoglycan-associated protein